MLELPYGLEGFCSIKNLVKEDGGKSEIGEALEFKVIEFSKEDRRIALSHKAVWSAEEQQKEPAKKKTTGASKGKSIDKINQETEKSTLGDIEALSALKEKMSASKGASSKDTSEG
jgi:small subunit ribosomal protein S1